MKKVWGSKPIANNKQEPLQTKKNLRSSPVWRGPRFPVQRLTSYLSTFLKRPPHVSCRLEKTTCNCLRKRSQKNLSRLWTWWSAAAQTWSKWTTIRGTAWKARRLVSSKSCDVTLASRVSKSFDRVDSPLILWRSKCRSKIAKDALSSNCGAIGHLTR